MSWQQWVLVVMFALDAVVKVATIGKQRDPLTPGAAAFCLVWNAAFIWIVVTA